MTDPADVEQQNVHEGSDQVSAPQSAVAQSSGPHEEQLVAGDPGQPERYLLIVRLVGADTAEAPRFLFARWPDWPHPAMLSVGEFRDTEALTDHVSMLLRARMGVSVVSAPTVSSERVPVRLPNPRLGLDALGWLRAAVVDVQGEPLPDALLQSVEVLDRAEAEARLPTEVERIVFRIGADSA
jgi:hypothetical protein